MDREDALMPPAWLDDVTGEQARAWVTEHNARTEAAYAADPDFAALTADLEAILDSPDRIPPVADRAGMLYNFWTDADHPRGIWRRTSWESYAMGAPAGRLATPTQWETLLDLDAASAQDGAEQGQGLVWGGAQVLTTGPLAGRRALVTLSPGGGDVNVTREFDLDAKRFIPPDEGGFFRPASRGSMTWGDADGESVILTADFGEGSLSPAGYPRQVRRLRRGQRPQDAEVLVTCAPGELAAAASRDPWGRTWLTTIPSFHATRIWLLPDDAAPPAGAQAARRALASEQETVAPGAVRLDVPESASAGVGRGWVTIELREPWEAGGRSYAPGTLLAAPLEEYLAGGRDMRVLFTPSAATSLEGATWTRNHLVLQVLDDVVNRLEVCTPPSSPTGEWGHHWIDLTGAADLPGGTAPESTELRPGRALLDVEVSALDASRTDYLWISASGWTTPSTLTVGRLTAAGEITGMSVLRQAPARYNATGVRVTQHVATSADGTRVPYFQVGRPRRDDDGDCLPGPTLLYGYGAFGKALTPGYEPVVGKAWLERGGTYVVANTRGGGEYGPGWHLSAVGGGRHRVLEDFAAVARSLIDRGVTTPQQLAVHGSS
ncbi:prolyl oligopeptidase family serine peptidase, partial [Actinomyces sp. MRS3W]|uniref:prolyl oligopeptidase family serine peptidase n=1 Tax=Actinomyces sp. MRS3W TaxID=2800796 RepID=UPI0028FD1261